MTEEKARAALGRLVRRRREDLALTLATAAAPMSVVSWRRVEQGEPVRRLTLTHVNRVLGWADGACQDFLDFGREPKPSASRHRTGEPVAVCEADYLIDRTRALADDFDRYEREVKVALPARHRRANKLVKLALEELESTE